MSSAVTARKSKKAEKAEKAEKTSMNPKTPPTKVQKAIIHWVRRNVPSKKTKFLHSHIVEYFAGSKAVDALVKDSPWSKGKVKEGSEYVFEYREQAVDFMDDMLKHKMFHRARKIPVQEKEKRTKKGKADKGKDKDKKDDKKDDKKEEKSDEKDEVAATPKTGDKDGGDKDDKKKKRKIRLDMHLEQVFIDSQDAYVWLYDPIPWYYWVGGTAIVLGIIGVCLFPLWPPMMRKGVHYLSVAAAGFLIFIIALGLFKYVFFGLLFALSAGKLKFWIFPNLTEDVGFMDSFWPIYDYTYTGKSFRRKRKEKDSDDEEEDDDEDEEGEENGNKGDKDNNSESDESTSKKSSTGKDFEMVDKNDTGDEND